MIVDSVMRRGLVTVRPDDSVLAAARLMRDQGVGSVVVESGGRLQGLVTERDLARRVVAEGVDPSGTLVREVMSTPVATIEASASLEAAAEAMRAGRVKRLVVVVGDEPRGMVTVTDLAYARPELTQRFLDTWVRPSWEG
jgi:CBS domain-containing protein